jgi:Tfp pilus assembly protein PilF
VRLLKVAFLFCVASSVDGYQSALQRGSQAYNRDDFATAEREFKQAVKEQPSSARAQKMLGLTYATVEKFELAEEPLRRACTLDPTEELACHYLGMNYLAMSRYEDARKAFEISLRSDAKNRRRAVLGMAIYEEAIGNNEAAERNYKAAVEAGNPEALKMLGMFLYRNGRGHEAIEYLRKANAKPELDRVTRALESTPTISSQRKPPVPIQFEARPLPMVVKNGASGEQHQIEAMLAGVAVFDYDNDGWPDIFVANGGAIPSLRKTDSSYSNRLFRNNRDGTFTDVTVRAGVAGGDYAMGVAAADYDNDGSVDLFVTGVRSNTLYRNRGDGTFEDVTRRAGVASDGRWAVAAGWFDYDNDGRLDLFLVRYVAWDPKTEPYCGEFKPGHRTYCHPKFYEALPNTLYHNEGGGRFRDVSGESGIGSHRGKGMGVAFGDYDGDGNLDIFVANDTMPNFLFRNNGNGTFTERGLAAGVAYNPDGGASSSMGVDFRDYDNDGREDLFVTVLTNERFLLFRNIGGEFSDTSGSSRIASSSLPWTGWGAGMFDLNNDGLKDLFSANGNVNDNADRISSRKSRQSNVVFLNRGDGVFDAQTLAGEALHRGAAFGDFDRDGRVDTVVTRLNEAPLVLYNRTPAAGHWIGFHLIGTRSNRDAIGARIRVTTPRGQQCNRITTSVGYAGSSDRVVHFGLGDDTKVTSLEIEWPSGIRQVLRDVRVDRYLTIEESVR